jgi:hypothetical protein
LASSLVADSPYGFMSRFRGSASRAVCIRIDLL